MSYHLAGLGAEPDPGATLPPDVSPTFISEMSKPVEKRRGWVAVPTFDMRQYVQAQLLTFAGGFVVGMGVGAIFGNLLAGKNVPGFGRLLSNLPQRRKRRSSRRRVRRNSARYVYWGYVYGGPNKGRWYAEAPDGRVELFGSETTSRRRASGIASRFRISKIRQGHSGNFDPAQLKRRRSSRRVRRNMARRQSPRRTSSRKRRRGRPTAKPVTERVTVKMPGGSIVVSVEKGFVKLDGRRVGSVYDLGTKFRSIPFDGEVRSFGTLAGAVKHVVRAAEKAA